MNKWVEGHHKGEQIGGAKRRVWLLVYLVSLAAAGTPWSLGTNKMTIRQLVDFAKEKPSRWDAPLFIISLTDKGYAQAGVKRIEIDEIDADLNFVIAQGDTTPGIACLRDIQEALTDAKLSDYVIYSRTYLERPIVVERVEFTHLDTFVYGVSESEAGAVGLFEQNTQKQK